MPVVTAVAVTVTPGSSAPLESVTRPVMTPWSCCARTRAGASVKKNTKTIDPRVLEDNAHSKLQRARRSGARDATQVGRPPAHSTHRDYSVLTIVITRSTDRDLSR